MGTKKKAVTIKYSRKAAKPRSSTAVMIKRYQAKLAKLKETQKLQLIRQEVADLQQLIKRGY
jgi:hypothetical protein